LNNRIKSHTAKWTITQFTHSLNLKYILFYYRRKGRKEPILIYWINLAKKSYVIIIEYIYCFIDIYIYKIEQYICIYMYKEYRLTKRNRTETNDDTIVIWSDLMHTRLQIIGQ
jgi:hypothetical protein